MESTESTETTTVESTTATTTTATEAPRPSVTLSMQSIGELPSQDGARGRPRGRGRAVVRMADGSAVDANVVREALARELEIRVSDVSRYTYKAPEGAAVFICARIPANEVYEYLAAPTE